MDIMNTKPSKRFFMSIILILFFPIALAASDLLYVQSARAPLLNKPFVGSEKLVELNKGTAVLHILEKGIWHQVIYKDKTGWVCKFMVGKTPPKDSRNNAAEQLEAFSGNARKRPSAFTTTAAARGLMDKRKRFAGKYKFDFSALEKIESITITDAEVHVFLRNGGLN